MKQLVLVISLVIASVACGPKPINTPQPSSKIGQTAVLGRQFVAAGIGTARGIDSVMESGILPREYGIPVLRVLNEIGEQSVRLADILRAIDEARTAAERTDAIGRARAVIVGFRSLLDGAVLPIADSKAKSVVISSLSALSAILEDFGDALMLMIAEDQLRQHDLLATARELDRFAQPLLMAGR